MGKLGKKARKFAKKNLQSVLRNKRKLKSKFKRKASRRDSENVEENQEGNAIDSANGRNLEREEIEDTSLGVVFSEDESEVLRDDSDSDGYLSEDSSCAHVTGSNVENENYVANGNGCSPFFVQNGDIRAELLNKTKRLNKLKKKDPGFSKYLESFDVGIEQTKDEETNSDEYERVDGMQLINEDTAHSHVGKLLTSASINSLCKLVKEQHSVPALTCLINAYRAACHNDAEATSVSSPVSSHGIQKSETFCKILMFMQHEADTIFRSLLGISSSSCKKEIVLDLKNTKKWLSVKPLIKSYLRSTMFYLNQVTDSEILTFSICRLRASIIFLAAFPSLLRKLLKIAVHLWATRRVSIITLLSRHSRHSFCIWL